MFLSIVAFVLTKALLTAEVCHAVNVTVTPGPVVMVTERDNLTLSCLASQRKRSNSVLILRWFFSPPVSPTDSTHHPSPEPDQFLIAKLGIKKIKLYGNYTRRFPRPKFRLFEEQEGEVFRLWILNVSRTDQGQYSCRVQEIRKLRNTWRASSNGTSSTQLLVHFTPEESRGEGLGQWFADVHLGAVLICCLGLLSIFLFTVVLSCQYFYRRHRPRNSYLFVKCPESSSGETVTSSSSSSSSSPKAQRRETRPTIPARTKAPPKLPLEPPPHSPHKVLGLPQRVEESFQSQSLFSEMKFRPDVYRRLQHSVIRGGSMAPVAAKRPQKPKRSKLLQQRAANDNLTYAELELVRPRPDPSTVANVEPASSDTDTVYAQILFQEKQV